ncbi:MAG: hypothetical protein HQ570_02595 [Candidatus Omnitrophica bacterium]|nr:hypothetical protein [Candidatus Omnitrophota bacterium]
MTEEANDKKVDEKKSCCACSKSGIKVVIGIVLISVGLVAAISWRSNLLVLLKGCIGLALIMAGAIAIAIAKE